MFSSLNLEAQTETSSFRFLNRTPSMHDSFVPVCMAFCGRHPVLPTKESERVGEMGKENIHLA